MSKSPNQAHKHNSTRRSSSSATCFVACSGDSFGNPNAYMHSKYMNKSMAPKLPHLPCFEAFGVMFCLDLFALYLWGAGVTGVFLMYAHRLNP